MTSETPSSLGQWASRRPNIRFRVTHSDAEPAATHIVISVCTRNDRAELTINGGSDGETVGRHPGEQPDTGG